MRISFPAAVYSQIEPPSVVRATAPVAGRAAVGWTRSADGSGNGLDDGEALGVVVGSGDGVGPPIVWLGRTTIEATTAAVSTRARAANAPTPILRAPLPARSLPRFPCHGQSRSWPATIVRAKESSRSRSGARY